jgi:hypothetical protein
MLRWLLLSAPLEISSLLSLGFEVVKMCVNLNDQLAREPYTPSPQPVALIARKLARKARRIFSSSCSLFRVFSRIQLFLRPVNI